MTDHVESKSQDENEGEGNRTAARRYAEGVAATVKEGRALTDAAQAEREVEANEDEYREAEEKGRARSAGEAPGDLG